MPRLVVNGAQLQCTMGTAPGTLAVLPIIMIDNDDKPMATIMDHLPIVNVSPFALCKSPSNPQVSAATAAAGGVLTPQPCVPVIPAPWTPGNAKVTFNQFPILTEDSTCTCTWAGTVSITNPNTTYVEDE